ncbi:MAG: outer membrane beta-barrel protein, partial [Cucumibacter sp.]
VFGVEADFNVASASGETQGTQITIYEYGSTVTSFGSIRKRAGFTVDNWLFFGTAGIAFASGEFWSASCLDNLCDEPEYQDVTHVGFVVGAGAEYALSDTVSIRKDLRFYNFGTQEVQLGATQEENVEYYLTAVTASVGLTWHF